MKCTTIIDKNREEEVLIYVHTPSAVAEEIENFVKEKSMTEIIGYKDKSIVKLHPHEVICFTTRENKVYALTKNEEFQLKERLYMLEEILDEDFVKINQSCIANIRAIKKFDASLAGALIVIFKNDYKDYVSRRQLKFVKERIGFTL